MSEKQTGMDIEEIIRQVKDAIDLAGRIEAAQGDRATVTIEKLELTLKAVAERSAGGDFKLKVPFDFSGGVDARQQEVQTVQITLVPPPPVVAKGLAPPDLKNSLVEAILSVGDGVRAAAQGEPKFGLEGASVELNFVVGSGGSISLVVRGAARSEMTQTVKLSLRSPI